MKLTIKSLKQVIYPVEIESDQIDVLELKKKIESVHQLDHSTINLVFNGSKLVDSKKLFEYNIKDENVIVMMSSKVKPVNVNSTPVVEETKKEEKLENKPNLNNQPQSQEPKTKKEYIDEVKMLVDMGFPKGVSKSAILAAKGNLSLAIEFLSSDNIENLPEELNEFDEEESQNDDSTALKNIASIVKVLCQNDPNKFTEFLGNLQQTSPELVELIQENESDFRAMIQAPITEEDIRNVQNFNQMGGIGGGSENVPSQEGENEQVIRLSKTEFDAVNRLKELGFNEREAVQAFFACDKNEELAANFLMENRIREVEEEELAIDCNLFF